MQNLVLIVAAGKGKRFGAELPKQYLPLNGKPIMQYCAEAFLSHPKVDAVKVVIAEGDEFYNNIGLSHPKLLPPVTGGAERQDSVWLGLESVAGLKPKNVLIHDAARPYISSAVITNVIEQLEKSEAAIPVVLAKDSARYQGRSIDRAALTMVQTPQGFDFEKILAAHKAATNLYSDDAQVAEAAGMRLTFVEGDERNMKITTKADLPSQPSFRVGTGFDVHEFETGTEVTICGIKVPHSHQLKGHSDADVGLHALVDAMLGAIGAGDIGEHFPPSKPEWRNVDSARFVEHALKLVREKNAAVENVDITIICEEPKLSTYKPQMKQRVADILNISADCVNIKATTTEKLGFTGRKEGIAAQAVAMVKFFS